MEIKTITSPRETGGRAFDEKVNEALAQGFQLVKRDMLPAVSIAGTHFYPLYYAELVKPDEPKAPEPMNVIDALNVVREFCDDHTCDSCPLYNFCDRHVVDGEGPTDWVLPGEEK